MLKFCQIIGYSQIQFFNCSGTEGVKQNNNKTLKTIQNLLILKFNHFSANFFKFWIFFWFSTETLTALLSVPGWAGFDTDLLSESNIIKMVNVNIVFTERFLKNSQ